MNDEEMTINAFNTLQFDDETNSFCQIDVFDMIVTDSFQLNHPQYPLEACLVHYVKEPSELKKIEECV